MKVLSWLYLGLALVCASQGFASEAEKIQCYLEINKDVMSLQYAPQGPDYDKLAEQSLQENFGHLLPVDARTAVYVYPDSIKISSSGPFGKLARAWRGYNRDSFEIVHIIRNKYEKDGLPRGCGNFVILR